MANVITHTGATLLKLYVLLIVQYLGCILNNEINIGLQVCLAFNPQSTMLATGSMDTTAKLWDIQTGVEICTLGVSLSSLYKYYFSKSIL